MREYMMTLMTVSVICGVIGVLSPKEDMGKYLSFVCGICALGIIVAPITELIKKGEIDIEEIDKIFQCVLIDHPEIFYADGYSFVKYTYGQEVRRVTFTGKFIYNVEETEAKKALIQQSADRILKNIPENLTDYEKVKKAIPVPTL